MMNIPYTAIHFATYESSKTYFGNGDDETLIMQLGAGGIAGGLAAAATTPMDVVKTRLQLEGLGSATKYNTISMVSLKKERKKIDKFSRRKQNISSELFFRSYSFFRLIFS
jgi:Mitochondrial carrier protein